MIGGGRSARQCGPHQGAFSLFSVARRGAGGTEGNVSPVGCPPKAEMTRSSGKQQAERTAVRVAPMVCPEESPPCKQRREPTLSKKFPCLGIDAPTTARNGTCRPMGFSPASVPEGFQRASGKPFGAPAGAFPPFPDEGMTRRLRRGSGLAVLGFSR